MRQTNKCLVSIVCSLIIKRSLAFFKAAALNKRPVSQKRVIINMVC
jgi:hypothetical protein